MNLDDFYIVPITTVAQNVALQNFLFSCGFSWNGVKQIIKPLSEMCGSETHIYINHPDYGKGKEILFGEKVLITKEDMPYITSYEIFMLRFIPIFAPIPNEGIYF